MTARDAPCAPPLARTRADTAPAVARLADETGYCLFKIGLSFDEIV